MPTPLVNFIVVGVQKAGTTALFDYLGDSPAVALSKVKEVHFFDDETVDWSKPDYGPYHAQFESSAPAALHGEATPIYLYWPGSLERIAAYNPDIRLIVMLRDPVERAWYSVLPEILAAVRETGMERPGAGLRHASA